MNTKTDSTIKRQYMLSQDFEIFHFKDNLEAELEHTAHNFFELLFLASGDMIYEINGDLYSLKPGDLLFIQDHELHKALIKPGQECEWVVLWINPKYLQEQSTKITDLTFCFSNLKGYNLLRTNIKAITSIKTLLEKFEVVLNSADYGSDILKKSYFIELMVYLNTLFLKDKNHHHDVSVSEKLNEILLFINENLAEKLSLDTLAEKFYISKYHLIREFKKYTGSTIHQYILGKRLNLARMILKDNIKLHEISSQCGFEDYSAFVKSFKKAFGMSPSKYRKEYYIKKSDISSR
jgi:AraC-like DNA-binding protein/mannose-6-phosphate isomerase-like protein (cupin superfamily)